VRLGFALGRKRVSSKNEDPPLKRIWKKLNLNNDD
jgi:hypothetical protein